MDFWIYVRLIIGLKTSYMFELIFARHLLVLLHCVYWLGVNIQTVINTVTTLPSMQVDCIKLCFKITAIGQRCQASSTDFTGLLGGHYLKLNAPAGSIFYEQLSKNHQ